MQIDLEKLDRDVHLKIHSSSIKLPSNLTPIKIHRQLEIYLSAFEENLKKQSRITRIQVKTEGELLQDPINDKEIMIDPVDEGNAIVVWDKNNHLKDSKNHLNDYIVYGEVTGDPLETLKQKIKIALSKVLKKKELIKRYTIIYLFISSHAFTYLKSKNV